MNVGVCEKVVPQRREFYVTHSFEGNLYFRNLHPMNVEEPVLKLTCEIPTLGMEHADRNGRIDVMKLCILKKFEAQGLNGMELGALLGLLSPRCICPELLDELPATVLNHVQIEDERLIKISGTHWGEYLEANYLAVSWPSEKFLGC